jgi:CheY-like chemotaxis protein
VNCALLIVEDQSIDLRTAASTALLSGFTHIECTSNPSEALKLLTKRLYDGVPLPDAMLLDLVLGIDSGYEILRFRYSNTELKKIPVLVWTGLLSETRHICELFEANLFLEKGKGAMALRESLDELRSLCALE